MSLPLLSRWLIQVYGGTYLSMKGDRIRDSSSRLKLQPEYKYSENGNDENQKREHSRWKSTKAIRLQTYWMMFGEPAFCPTEDILVFGSVFSSFIRPRGWRFEKRNEWLAQSRNMSMFSICPFSVSQLYLLGFSSCRLPPKQQNGCTK